MTRQDPLEPIATADSWSDHAPRSEPDPDLDHPSLDSFWPHASFAEMQAAHEEVLSADLAREHAIIDQEVARRIAELKDTENARKIAQRDAERRWARKMLKRILPFSLAWLVYDFYTIWSR